MEDAVDPLETSPSSAVGRRSFEADLSGNQNGELSMPICFLVKEQAKSHVAIQDLQKRVEGLENIQNDVIDSLAEIRKFLCADSKSFSTVKSFNVSNDVTSLSIPKVSKVFYSPSDIQKPDSCTSKVCANIGEYPLKQFECKSKELALESDKQDSGLDSDQLSLHRHSLFSGKPESGDELLQLLDEISVRTEVLQKQLTHSDPKEEVSGQSRPSVLGSFADAGRAMSNSVEQNCAVSGESLEGCLKLASGAHAYLTSDGVKGSTSSQNCTDSHYLASLQKMEKKAIGKIDSAMVSSILKETSVVDLQRQVLIYLVENAVLHTKVNELTQLLSSKTEERNKMEISLRDESRLLMMENRELRINLDEQKLETNSLRSKLLMMERVLGSVSFENRELTCQLGELLGLQNTSQKEHRLSSSYTYGDGRVNRRSSLHQKASAHSDPNLSCAKSRLFSNASSLLDVTLEEPEHSRHVFLSPTAGFEGCAGPVHSSTPLGHSTKLKEVKMSLRSVAGGNNNLHSVKNCLKSDVLSPSADAESRDSESSEDKLSELAGRNFRPSSRPSVEGTPKFPFNTILEKLKANSEYRLSRASQESNLHSSENPLRMNSKSKLPSEISEPSETFLQTTPATQGRKNKNIHQRIQKILDRITSESEDPS